MAIDYVKATDEEIQIEMIAKYKAEKLAEIETDKIKAFNDAKDAEFEKLRLKQDTAKIQFGKDCQTAEDAGYDVSQIPDGDTY